MIVIIAFAYSLISVLVSSGVATLCVGAAHSYDPRIPALGYPPVFFLVLAVFVVAMGTRIYLNVSR